MKYKTQQEEFWAGEFGDAYIARNQGEEMLASNLFPQDDLNWFLLEKR